MENRSVYAPIRGGYLEALLHSCPDAVLAIDSGGTITFANKEASRLTERSLSELVGQSITIVYESIEAARETNRRLYEGGGVVRDHESRVKNKTGKIVPVRISASHLRDSAGNYAGAVGFFQIYRPWPNAEARTKAYADELESRLETWKDNRTAVSELFPGIAYLGVTGRLCQKRFTRINNSLVNHINSNRTRVVRINLSQAFIEDNNAVARELIRTIRLARLLGVESILTGIGLELAQALEPIVDDMNLFKTFTSNEEALQAALNVLNLKITGKE